MNYITSKGDNKVVFVFHGTGGNKEDMVAFGKQLFPNNTIVGIDGEVMEGPYRRYFKRTGEGVFDEESINQATTDVFELINDIKVENNFIDNNISLLGFSNGANLLIHMLKTKVVPFKNIVALHPNLGIREIEFKNNDQTNVIITYSKDDPIIPLDSSQMLVLDIKKRIKNLFVFKDGEGHRISRAEALYFTSIVNNN